MESGKRVEFVPLIKYIIFTMFYLKIQEELLPFLNNQR